MTVAIVLGILLVIVLSTIPIAAALLHPVPQGTKPTPISRLWTSPTPPPDPAVGDMWFKDTGHGVAVARMWNGAAWLVMSGKHRIDLAPHG